MISIKVTLAPAAPKQILVELSGNVTNLRGLNAVLADRLSDELQQHFRAKNAKPNKRGWAKTNFWQQLANATEVASVSDSGAVVTVAEERFRIHVTGGTITPKKAKALTIPLIEAARGLSASSYAKKFTKELFTIPGRNALFEVSNSGGETIGRTATRVRKGKRTLTIPLSGRSIRPVYALVPRATIPADPDALPSAAAIQDALLEEAATYFEGLA